MGARALRRLLLALAALLALYAAVDPQNGIGYWRELAAAVAALALALLLG